MDSQALCHCSATVTAVWTANCSVTAVPKLLLPAPTCSHIFATQQSSLLLCDAHPIPHLVTSSPHSRNSSPPPPPRPPTVVAQLCYTAAAAHSSELLPSTPCPLQQHNCAAQQLLLLPHAHPSAPHLHQLHVLAPLHLCENRPLAPTGCSRQRARRLLILHPALLVLLVTRIPGPTRCGRAGSTAARSAQMGLCPQLCIV